MVHKPLPNLFLALAFYATLYLCLNCSLAFAENWKASIQENGTPKGVVAVDKKNGIFNFFEKKSPLGLRYSYPCVTGQLSGDKYQLNDLKTPEGVYFVEYKISAGLDFKEYGGIAYTLNYPNPVDRLRGKTGHGIWIHSKGYELVPTRGCVAINLDDIAEVGPSLVPGTPVVLAEQLNGISNFDDGVPAKLAELMNGWSRAWQNRSAEMFRYYNTEAYTKATENFDAFKQNKEKLFKTLSFIKIYNRKIHAMEGPGYWVTWTEQLYTASNLSTEGIRRLYWQKDNSNDFKIVGMEWIPRDVGMRADFQKGKLVAEGPVQTVSDVSSEAPRVPRIDMPEQPVSPMIPDPMPEQKKSEEKGPKALALAENLLAVGEPLVPKQQPRTDPPDEIVWGAGRKLTEPSESRIQQQEQQKTVLGSGQKVINGEKLQDAGSAIYQDKDLTEINNRNDAVQPAQNNDEDKLAAALIDWKNAIKTRNSNIQDLYDQKNFNRLPPKMGVPRWQSLQTHLSGINRDMMQTWLTFISSEPEINDMGEVKQTKIDMLVITPQGSRQGEQYLWWHKDDAGDYKIAGAQFKNMPKGLEANYLESVTGPVSAMIENWRNAWQTGDIDKYIDFYMPNAWQQGKAGAVTIRKQKESLWSRVRPELVEFAGLRLIMEPKGIIRADMNQAYADSSGKSDRGIKTLFLQFDGGGWKILREDWVAVAPKIQ